MFESSSGGTELHFIKSVAFAHLPRLIGRGIVRGARGMLGVSTQPPRECVNKQHEIYLFNDYLSNIYP